MKTDHLIDKYRNWRETLISCSEDLLEIDLDNGQEVLRGLLS